MKKIAFVLILIFVCFQAKAQPGGLGGFAYSMGQPTWETKDFINEFSWRGIAIEYKHFNSQSLSTHDFWGFGLNKTLPFEPFSNRRSIKKKDQVCRLARRRKKRIQILI